MTGRRQIVALLVAVPGGFAIAFAAGTQAREERHAAAPPAAPLLTFSQASPRIGRMRSAPTLPSEVLLPKAKPATPLLLDEPGPYFIPNGPPPPRPPPAVAAPG